MTDDEKRPGDWQRRDLRGGADNLAGAPDSRTWYDHTFWIVFLRVVFWPAGIVLAWRSDWHVAAKVLATVLVAAAVWASWSMSQAVQQMQAG